GPSGASSAEDDLDLELGLRLEAGAAWRWGSRWRDLKRRFMLERLQFLPKEGDSLRMEKLVRRPGDPGLPLGGILPLSVDSEVPEEETVALRRALSHVRWLYARRTGPSRHGSPRGTIGRIHEDGAQIGAMLLADPALRSRVSRWYELHLNRRIDVESLGADQERLVLVAGGHTSAFPDTGEGVQQAFPVVAALEYLREHGGTLLVEEPESNLHPRLQEALAALVVEVVAANDHAQVIMETHSEVFLWSAYAVAAQHPSSPVSILWVESGADGAGQVIPVGLDPDGRPQTDRMQRAFETMGVLERRVLSARRGARARTPRH
ncbi:MAG TPA: AAA family ATPase, partial [Myxococcota bacterium]|nr:AAA family ATPase [Myxococcota bacterium]